MSATSSKGVATRAFIRPRSFIPLRLSLPSSLRHSSMDEQGPKEAVAGARRDCAAGGC